MKAVLFSYPPHVEVKEKDIPSPESGEVLIQVKAAALCGTDLRIARRGHGSIQEGEERILGHEVVGVVVKRGRGVENLREGMHVAIAPNYGCGTCSYCIRGLTHHCSQTKAIGVTVDGGFAEFMVVPEKAVAQGNVMLLPDTLDFVKVSFVEALACVVHGFLPLNVGFQDTVLIYGAGPIGLMFWELSRRAGAKEIWIADISSERLQVAKERGAKTILSGKESVKEVVRCADVVIVAAPSPEAQREALEIAGTYGRINFFGGLPPQIREVPLSSNLIHYKELLVTGTTKSNNFHFRYALDLLISGILDLSYLVTHVLPLENIEEGLKLMESQQSLKVVLVP
ncbi:MAG: alcohol dehydrogenase catalytic domain-containing protein [Candidatus Caldatribacteriaceae bacterium]